MSGILFSVLTACLTVLIGVVVFALQKLFEKLYIERIIEYNKIWKEIDQRLIFYAHKITDIVKWDNIAERNTVSNDILRLSSELGALQLTNNYSWILKKFTYFPKENILKAFKPITNLAVEIQVGKKINGETFNRYLNDIETALKQKTKITKLNK